MSYSSLTHDAFLREINLLHSCVSYTGGFALLRRFYTKSKKYYIPWRLQHSRNNKISISVASEISASQPHYRPRHRSPSLDGPRASSLQRAPGVGRSIPGRAGTAGRRGPGRRVTRQQQPQQQQPPRMMSRQAVTPATTAVVMGAATAWCSDVDDHDE